MVMAPTGWINRISFLDGGAQFKILALMHLLINCLFYSSCLEHVLLFCWPDSYLMRIAAMAVLIYISSLHTVLQILT